jgi:hypothetical protein
LFLKKMAENVTINVTVNVEETETNAKRSREEDAAQETKKEESPLKKASGEGVVQGEQVPVDAAAAPLEPAAQVEEKTSVVGGEKDDVVESVITALPREVEPVLITTADE